jgi:hypothetical protein
MRKVLVTVGLLAGATWLGTSALNACGDKFLLIGHGAGFQKGYAAVHPASILIYVQGKSAKALAIRDPQLAAGLKRAGHKVNVLEDRARLIQTLNSARYDIVLADFSDAIALESEVRASNAKPALVPVMYDPSKADMADAEKQFVCLLKAPEKITHFLNVIDDLMKTRLDAAKATSPKSK